MAEFTLEELQAEIEAFQKAEAAAPAGPYRYEPLPPDHPLVTYSEWERQDHDTAAKFQCACRPSADPQHWSKRMRWMLERIEELEAENATLRAALATPEVYAGVVSQVLERERDAAIREAERLRRLVQNGFDVQRVVDWMYSEPRKHPSAAFTAGGERQAAYLCQMAETYALSQGGLESACEDIVALKGEIQRLRTVIGIQDGETLVEAGDGWYVADSRGGQRRKVTMMADELRELERLRRLVTQLAAQPSLTVSDVPLAADALRENVSLTSRVENLERLIGMQPHETLEAAEERMRLQGDCFVRLEQENERLENLLRRCRDRLTIAYPFGYGNEDVQQLKADIDAELRGDAT